MAVKNVKTGWNLGLLYPDFNKKDIERDLEEVKKANTEFSSYWRGRNDYLEKPEILERALDQFEKISSTMGVGGKPGYYYWLKNALNQQDPDIKAELGKIDEIGIALENDQEFFTHNISKIPESKQKEFLEYPGLAEYKHFLEILFKTGKYLLSEPEEKILNLTSRTSHENWIQMVSDFISREEREVKESSGAKSLKNFSELLDTINSTDQTLRDSAAFGLNEIFLKHAPAAEYELNSILHNKKVNDELRGFKRPDFSRHIADDIDSEIVDSMIEAVSSRYDISKRYYKLKARLMGKEKLQYHERNVDYGNLGGDYSLDKAVETVSQVFGNLDPEFQDIFESFMTCGQIDLYSKKGKDSGAFCIHTEKELPCFVLLNYTGRFDDLRTLAHEMGHAINFELTKKRQNALNCGSFTCTAEVASTFMENFVLDHVQENSDEETKLAIMLERINGDVSSIHRQVACYNFEKELHLEYRKNGYLSLDKIGKIFQKHMAFYMGDGVEMSPGSENWWVYWSHVRNYFYVYSYSSGVMISRTLKKMVEDDPAYVGKIKEFLGDGTSMAPSEQFLKLGVDISDSHFWKMGLEKLSRDLDEAELLAEKLRKLK